MKYYIVEDDFWVAHIHETIVTEIDPDASITQFRKGTDFLNFLQKNDNPEGVLLLDIYLPDISGLHLLKEITFHFTNVSTIVISAANDQQTIVQSKRLGVFDYLLKPVNKELIIESITRLKKYLTYSHSKKTWNQKDIHRLFYSSHSTIDELPKGIQKETLLLLESYVSSNVYKPQTASEIAKKINLSRSTARRYLEYLVHKGSLSVSLQYQAVGRPRRCYIYHEQKEQNKQ